MRCLNCAVPVAQTLAKALDGTHAVVWASTADADEWTCPVTGDEHEPTDAAPYWVVIERRTWEGEFMDDLVIGPYPSPEAAQLAMEESLLVDGICTDTKRAYSVEDDVYVSDAADPEGERLYVDLSNPDHTGAAPANGAES